MSEKMNSIYDFTDRGLVELKAWMEPWWQQKRGDCECVPVAPVGETVDAVLAEFDPSGIWKLDESTGSIAADSSGNGLDMSTISPELDPLWGQPAGPPGTQTADFGNGTGGLGGTASRVSRTWAALTSDFTAGIWISRNDTASTMVMGQGNPNRSSGAGWMLAVNGAEFVGDEENRPYAALRGPGSLLSINELAAETWAFVAMTYNADTAEYKLYLNGLLESTADATGYVPVGAASPLWIGHDAGLGGNAVQPAYFVGSYAFLIPSALTDADMLRINNAADVTASANAGKALLANGFGGSYWDFSASAGGGSTAARPTVTAIGISYFDTTLGKPIWWNGTVWKDATGTTV